MPGSLVIAGKGPAFEAICERNPDAKIVHSGEPLKKGTVLLSVQYDRIVTGKQLANFDHALNLHFGPLPEYRGCFPTKWAIINDEHAGVTLHHMVEEIDAGPILDLIRVPSRGKTDGELYQDLNDLAVLIYDKWHTRINDGDLPEGFEQAHDKATYYPRELPFGGKRNPDWPAWFTERVERAFTHEGYPGLQ